MALDSVAANTPATTKLPPASRALSRSEVKGCVDQGLPIEGTARDEDLDPVGRGADQDRVEGTPRNRPGRVAEIPGHVDPRHDPRHRGEVDGEDGPEALPSRVARAQVLAKAIHIEEACGTAQHADDGQDEHGQDQVLHADRVLGSDPGHDEQDDGRGEGDPLGVGLEPGERGHERGGEAQDVEGDTEGLSAVEAEPDGTAELGPHDPRDEEVGPSAFDAGIRADRGDGERRERGDRLRQHQDDERLEDAGLADHEAGAHEHDHAEDREDRRREHAAERAEPPARRRALP